MPKYVGSKNFERCKFVVRGFGCDYPYLIIDLRRYLFGLPSNAWRSDLSKTSPTPRTCECESLRSDASRRSFEIKCISEAGLCG